MDRSAARKRFDLWRSTLLRHMTAMGKRWLVTGLLAAVALAVLPTRPALAAVGDITTVAGGFVGDGGPASNAMLISPTDVAVDAAGNLFIADASNRRVRRVDRATGVITTVAGNGDRGFSGDGGPATSAMLNQPEGVAVDTSGNLFIADGDNRRVRRVDRATGIITTVAGSGPTGPPAGAFSGDGGPATSARLKLPSDVAVDAAGNLFIVDSGKIRRVAATSEVINTVAGLVGNVHFAIESVDGIAPIGDGGPATSAKLGAAGVAVDGSGNLFIADSGNQRIRRVDAATGIITTVAGSGEQTRESGFGPIVVPGGFSGDGGPATSARLDIPADVALDAAGNLFVVDLRNHRIRRVDRATGTITTVAGSGPSGSPTGAFSGDGGPATNSRLDSPEGIAVDAGGNLFIADRGNRRIRRVDAATAFISTLAGVDSIGDGSPAISANLSLPAGVAVDAGGNLFIADRFNHRIRRADRATSIITTVAGSGPTGPPAGAFSGDGGPATSARLKLPSDVAVDAAGNLFIADAFNLRIRRVDGATGMITTVAGNGTSGFSDDGGPAINASLTDADNVAVDGAGNLFIAVSTSHRVRRVDRATGIITTVAGSGPMGLQVPGFSGDGGPATSAILNRPKGVAVDGSGNLFIVDSGNQRIRRVDAATGIITTVAGSGSSVLHSPSQSAAHTASQSQVGGFGDDSRGFAGDGGPATSARLDFPEGVAVDAGGNLFIADRFNHRIRRVDRATGIINTVVGSGPTGIRTGAFSGDGGSATNARLNEPSDVAADAAGNLFIADSLNDRVRKVEGGAAAATTISGTLTLQGRTASFPTGVGHGIARVTLNPSGVIVNVNADGSFQFSNVAAGTFTLVASAAGYVSRERTNVMVAGSPVTAPATELRCGLVDSNIFVNINDITATVASFGTSPANRVDAQGRFVDQNGDGFVNINDITCVVSGFGTTSPLPWP